MSFQVSIVLTGATILSPNIQVYSNPVSNINHGTFVTTVAQTCLTTNSPCTVSVPDGTVTVRLLDSISYCYWDLPTCSSDVCNTCELGFANILDNQLGTVSIGNLTGSCDSSIDDFRVEWLGPNSLTTTGFTSGKGTQYVYASTHPLTGSSAPIVLPGIYVGRITNVNLNNVKFSSINGLPGHVYSPTLTSCTTTVNVDCLSCINGTYNDPNYPYYTHFNSYRATNPLSIPDKLQTLFQLGNGTKFFVFSFNAFSIYDTIKLTLTGSSYPVPIVLEDYRVGGNTGANEWYPNTFPKKTTSEYVKKIVTLTGLTITNNDYLNIQLTPNSATTNTSWDLLYGCRQTISYEKNCLNTYKNTPYKIQLSSITGLTGNCTTRTVRFNISGCTDSQVTGLTQSDFISLTSDSFVSQLSTSNSTGLKNLTFGVFTPSYNYVTIIGFGPPYVDATCSATTSIYTYQKVTGTTASGNQIILKFQNQNDSTNFQNQFTESKNTATTGWNSLPTSTDYYRFMLWYYVKGISINQVCADAYPLDFTNAYISSQSTISATTISGPYPYQVSITTPTMSINQSAFPDTTCGDNYIPTVINSVNTFATGTTISEKIVTSKNILAYTFYQQKYYTYSSSETKTEYEEGYFQMYPSYNFLTYASSGATNTLLPQFSGSPIPYQRLISEFKETPYLGASIYSQKVFKYEVRLVDFTFPIKFQIWAYKISNFDYDLSTGFIKIYDNTLPNPVVDPSFFF
jgi:hypothetical protein